MKNRNLIAILAGVCLYGFTCTSYAVDLFIKADGIEGSSLDANHEKWSDATALSGNISLGICGSLMLEKPLDRASLKYVEKAFSGEVIPKIEIEYVETIVGERVTVAKIEFRNGYIAEVAISNTDSPLSEVLTIASEEIKMTHFEYSNDGNLKGKTETFLTCPQKVKK